MSTLSARFSQKATSCVCFTDAVNSLLFAIPHYDDYEMYYSERNTRLFVSAERGLFAQRIRRYFDFQDNITTEWQGPSILGYPFAF